jgi:hypothetical protein
MGFLLSFKNWMKNSDGILILTCGVALGTYIPSLILCKQLKKRDKNSELFVIESLLSDNKQQNILKTKFAFHRDFQVALMGQRITGISDYSIDETKRQSIYEQWDNVSIVKILIFSGFWLPVVENYINTRKRKNISVDFCHLDSTLSTSWKKNKFNKINHREIWFYNLNDNKVYYNLNISLTPPIDFKLRHNRYVIHGGGWGVGTYKEKIKELSNNNINLDIICYEPKEIENSNINNRSFLIDPNWKIWEKVNSEYIFPPFKQVFNDKYSEFNYDIEYPAVYNLIQHSCGIISKPGGATLIDSLSSGTPVVFLEPYGEYERANAELWKKLGFGIDYDTWISLGCSSEILFQMHCNIIKSLTTTQNIIDLYT